MRARAVGPLDLETLADYGCGDFKQVPPDPFGTMAGANGLRGKPEEGRFAQHVIELPEIVETDFSPGAILEAFSHRRRAEISKDTITDAVIGHRSGLVRDALNQFPRVRRIRAGDIQQERVTACKP